MKRSKLQLTEHSGHLQKRLAHGVRVTLAAIQCDTPHDNKPQMLGLIIWRRNIISEEKKRNEKKPEKDILQNRDAYAPRSFFVPKETDTRKILEGFFKTPCKTTAI